MFKRVLGLCEGRHETPEVEGYIYDRELNAYVPQEMNIKGYRCNSDNCLLISS